MGSSLVHGSNDPGLIPALYADSFFFFFSLVKSFFFGRNALRSLALPAHPDIATSYIAIGMSVHNEILCDLASWTNYMLLS